MSRKNRITNVRYEQLMKYQEELFKSEPNKNLKLMKWKVPMYLVTKVNKAKDSSEYFGN
jgi:hypothetical protein